MIIGENSDDFFHFFETTSLDQFFLPFISFSNLSLFLFPVYMFVQVGKDEEEVGKRGERDEGVVLFDCLRLVGERR